MADNPNPDHLRGWGAPIPDRLTPEERETLEDCRRRPGFGIPSVLFQAFDRLAPKPAAEQKPADVPSGTFTVSERGASRFNAGKGVGTVYVQSSLDQPIEVTFRAKPAPDPDREAREAVTALCDDPHWFGGGTSQRLETIRAHGFTHRSEGAQTPNAEVVRLLREWEADLRWQAKQAHDRQPPEPELELAYQNKADALEGAAYRFADLVPSPAPPPAAVDVVREALNFCGYAGTGAAALTAALAARGVTFGGKA